MQRKPTSSKKKGIYTSVWVYSLVFGTRVSLAVVFVLLVSFLIQPFHKAFAAEEESTENEVATETAIVAEEVKEQQVSTEVESPDVLIESTDDNVSEGDPTENNFDSKSVAAEEESTTQSATTSDQIVEIASTLENLSTTTLVSNGSTTNEANNFEQSTSSSFTNTHDSESNSAENNSTTTNSSEVNEFQDSNQQPNQEVLAATSTPQQPKQTAEKTDSDLPQEESNLDQVIQERVIEVQSLVNEQNFYQFSRQSCVAIGDGTYHCSLNDTPEIDPSAVVYAAMGDNQNMEIFLRTKRGETKQITDNDHEDASPFYDPTTGKMVWQRMIDGRYQIITYDIAKDKETQLTFSRTNNMEPKMSDAGIVWQAWDGNDWEIMYFDGTYTEQITDNDSQDVTPVIEENYILWSVLGGKEQEARVYSLDSKQIMTITGHEGGSIVNPRFVLVYDTRFDNGDVITQGFDPATGISAPISATPAPDPVDIPTPDPIGEIRALIQNKSSHEDEFNLDMPQSDDTSTSTPNFDVASSSDLNLKAPQLDSGTTSIDITSTSTTLTEFELDEYDLVIVSSSTPNELPIVSTTQSSSSANSTQP